MTPIVPRGLTIWKQVEVKNHKENKTEDVKSRAHYCEVYPGLLLDLLSDNTLEQCKGTAEFDLTLTACQIELP